MELLTRDESLGAGAAMGAQASGETTTAIVLITADGDVHSTSTLHQRETRTQHAAIVSDACLFSLRRAHKAAVEL